MRPLPEGRSAEARSCYPHPSQGCAAWAGSPALRIRAAAEAGRRGTGRSSGGGTVGAGILLPSG